jgi:hypothetical protein
MSTDVGSRRRTVPKLGLNRLTLDDMNELDPEQALAAAVLRMAWHDLESSDEKARADAEAFWDGHGGDLWAWLELLGLERAAVARRLRARARQ